MQASGFFPDSPRRGAYARNEVCMHIASWGDFAPWLERIEQFPAAELGDVADEVPCEWYCDIQSWNAFWSSCLSGAGSFVD